jgi:transposase-like protein
MRLLLMATTPKTLTQAIQYFTDADNCLNYLRDRRWPDGKVACPTCGRTDVSFVPSRHLWQCKTRHPKAQFSIKTGTILEESPLGLDKWLPVMWMVANCKNGVSSWEIHRSLGVTQKTAWFMLHRVRLGMQNKPEYGTMTKLGGGTPESEVEVDETFVGGRVQNMHKGRKLRYQQLGGMHGGKAIVAGILDRDARQVRAKVIPNVKRETLQDEILNNVKFGSTIYTDDAVRYDKLHWRYVHEVVNHSQEYVRGRVHTNGMENFWSLLKRGLKGTYVAVEPFHLDRYIDEQVFRYNNRATKDNPLNDADRFSLLCSQIVGKRLTYAELTAKGAEKPEAF